MNIMQFFSFISLMVLLPWNLKGQNEYVSVPSANASSIVKAGDVPINYSNGTSQVSFPLYNLSDNDISVPISLNYQTGGLKVTDVSSSVGSGWNLEAGGTITRTVRDLPDDLTSLAPYGPAGYLGYHSNPSAYNSDATIDHTPDLYYYNILGYSGSFTINANGVAIFENATDVKIEIYTSTVGVLPFYWIKYFKVILPTGYVGYFGYYNNVDAIDISVSYNQEDVDQFEEDPDICWDGFQYFNCIKSSWIRSSWNIVQITSPSNRKIDFDYDLERYLEYRIPEQTVGIRSPCLFNIDYNPSEKLSYHEIYQNRIKTITSDYFKVLFDYDGARNDIDTESKYSSFNVETVVPEKLNSIEIQSKTNGSWVCNKKYNLFQSYTHAQIDGFNYPTNWIEGLNDNDYPDFKRMFLDKIVESSCDGTSSYETNLTYYNRNLLARRLSHAQDYWGGNNGKSSNLSLIARPIYGGDCLPKLDCRNSSWYKFADREPEVNFGVAGSLQSIAYPNGSLTQFVFEQNEIRAKELNLINIAEYKGETCNVYTNDCNTCQSNITGQTFEITGINYGEHSHGSFEIPYKYNTCIYGEGTIFISSRISGGTYSLVETIPIGSEVVGQYTESGVFTRINSHLQGYGWQYGSIYDLKVEVTTGFEIVEGIVLINNYAPQIINRQVGGLRIGSLQTNSLVKKYTYIATQDLTEPAVEELFSMEVCNIYDCPTYPQNGVSCNNQNEAIVSDIYIPCDGSLTLTILTNQVSQPSSCMTGYMHFEVGFSPAGSNVWTNRYFVLPYYVPSATLDEYDWHDMGLLKGRNYDFRLAITEQYGKPSATMIFEPSNSYYEPQGDYISSGELITPASQLSYIGEHYEHLRCANSCYYGEIFVYTTSPQTQFQSNSGGHVLYTNVTEEYYSNDDYYGKTLLTFDNTVYPGIRPITNNYSAIQPIAYSYPSPSKFYKSPTYGSLIKKEIFDSEGNQEWVEVYEYLIHPLNSNIVTDYFKTWEICGGGVQKFFYRHRIPRYVLLPKKVIRTEYGMTKISESFYREDFLHLNPIKIESYIEGHPDKVITILKYAHDVGNQLLISNNMTSIPLETITDNGLGGGAKVQYSQVGSRILPNIFSKLLDDGNWQIVKSIYEYTPAGLPYRVGIISQSEETKYIWNNNGLLDKIQYGEREHKFEYNSTRQLLLETDYQGIITQYGYDELLRLQSKSINNGNQRSEYDYIINNNGNSKILIKTFFANDGIASINLPVWESEQLLDVNGRNSFLIKKNFTFSGNDLVTGSHYGPFGEVLQECNPKMAGCDTYEYSLSPLRRLIKVTPAGSNRAILHSVSSNNIAVSIGNNLNYPVNTLIKKSVIDENGVQSDEYINIRGNVVMTCRDPNGLNLKTYYSYNKRDNLLVVYPPGSVGDGDDVNYEYTYFNDGQLKTKRIPDEGVYSFTYNAQGAAESITKPNGYLTEYSYHSTYNDFLLNIRENNLITKEITPFQGDFKKGWIGSIALRTDDGNTLTTTYDSRDDIGRILSETRQYYLGRSEFSYIYDDAGNVRFTTRNHEGPDPNNNVGYSYYYHMPKGFRVDEVNLKLGGLSSLTKFTYDDNDWMRTKSVGDGLHIVSYDYNSRGWLKEINSVELPPLAPNDDCETYVSNDEPLSPSYPNCQLIGEDFILKLLYNCNSIKENDSTSVSINIQSSSSSQNILIPINNGNETNYTDEVELLVSADEMNDLYQILNSLLWNCFETSEDGIKKEFELHGIINSILAQIHEEGSSSLFGMKLHYFDGNSELDAPPQFAGNVSWVEWKAAGEYYQSYGYQYDNADRLLEGKYQSKSTRCKITPANYDFTYGYDSRGNITNLTRAGFLGITTAGVPQYGIIDQLSYSYTGGNQLYSVSESSNQTRGYIGSSSIYHYNNGRLTLEQGARAAGISYNYLNQPTLIKVSNINSVNNTWDANGTLQKVILYDQNGVPKHVRLYHDGIEYLDGVIQCISHDEGRYVFEYEANGSFKRNYHEFTIADNVGNVRLRFADLNGDKKINIHDEGPGQEKEILGSFHYYPFGQKMEGIFHEQGPVECRYLYNGIEHVNHSNLNIDLATWRTLDPAISRWWQVDPKAEFLYALTPFNSMNNNPIIYSDPNGDLAPLILFGISAIVGGTLNGIQEQKAGGSFWGGFVSGVINAGASAGVGAGIGSIFGEVGKFGHELGRSLAHGVGDGILEFGQTGRIGSGFISGGISSGLGSYFKKFGEAGTLLSSGLGGGISSELSGGDFTNGAMIGFAVAAFNHIAEDISIQISTIHKYKIIHQGSDPTCLLACGAMIGGLPLKDFKKAYIDSGGRMDENGANISDFNSFMRGSSYKVTDISTSADLYSGIADNWHVIGFKPESGSSSHAVLIIRFKQWNNGQIRIKFIDPFIGAKASWNFKDSIDWSFTAYK